MTLFLDKVDSAPLSNSEFPFDFNQWVAVLVDTLNEVINDVQGAVLSVNVVDATVSLQSVTVNSQYIPGNPTVVTQFQLPDQFAVGVRVTIAGEGAMGWQLLTGAGQTIQIADVGASANTSVASSSRYDSIELIGVVANTTWITLSTQTTGFVIV